ncbi:MAG: ABC transporter substrate-binding protein [Flavobacteriaceae bacterium]
MTSQLHTRSILKELDTPKRIVSLVPSQTELLYDLGLEANIVGVTKFCVHPISARKNKVVVGGTKNIHLEKIKQLHPDIILCNKEENTKEIVTICKEITTTHVSNIFTLEDANNLILEYGKIFSKNKEAIDIVKKIQYQMKEFKKFTADKPIIKVAYFIWKSPWMVAANNTFIHYILKINNFQNIYEDLERYPTVDLGLIKNGICPELIFLSSEPYPFKENHVQELKEQVLESKIILVDGEMFSWYGSRMLKAFKYFKKLRLSIE